MTSALTAHANILTRAMQAAFLALLIASSLGCANKATVVALSRSTNSIPDGRLENDPMLQFFGTWEGQIEYLSAPCFVDAKGRSMRFGIAISSDEVRISTYEDGHWGEIKHGFFSTRWAQWPAG